MQRTSTSKIRFTRLNRLLVAALLAGFSSAQAHNLKGNEPGRGVIITAETPNGIAQTSGQPAVITGKIKLADFPDRGHWRSWDDDISDLLRHQDVQIRAFFPDLTNEVTSQLIIKKGRSSSTFQFTSPALNASDLNILTVTVANIPSSVRALQKVQAKIDRRIHALTELIERLCRDKALRAAARELERLQAKLAKVSAQIADKLARQQRTLAELHFPLQVDNQIAASSYNSTVMGKFRISIAYGPGSAVEGEKAQVQAQILNLRNAGDDGDDRDDLWLARFFWNGDKVKEIGPGTLPGGSSLSFAYTTNALDPEDENLFTAQIYAADKDWKGRIKIGALFAALGFEEPVAHDTVAPKWADGSSIASIPPYIKMAPALSAQVQDAFGLMDPASIHANLNFTPSSGVASDVDVTSKFLIQSPDQGQTYSLQGDINPLFEGTYVLSLTASDLSGRAATPNPLQASFRVDRTAPVLALGSQDHTLTNQRSFVLPVTVTDVSPTTTTVIQNGATVLTSSEPAFTATIQLSEGLNTFEVSSVDAAGNASAQAMLVDIVLDTAGPVLANISPASGVVIPTLSFAVSGQSNEKLSYAKVNGSNLVLSTDQQSFSGIVSAQVEGPFSLHFEAADLAGNTATLDRSVQIVLKVLNADLLAVVPSTTGNQLEIRGAPGATRPGLTVSASASFFNSGSTTAGADGSFVIKLFPFTDATVTATDSSIGRTDTAVVHFGMAGGTKLAGTVKDTDGNPLASVRVSIQGTSLITTTDASGVFVFSQPVTGDQILVVDGTTIPVLPPPAPQRKFAKTLISISIGVSQANVLGRSIYLAPIPIDGSGTTITTAAGGAVTDPNAPGVELDIESGVTTFPDGASSGVIALRTIPAEFSTIAPMPFAQPTRVLSLEPSGLAFSEPMALRLPNENQLPPGTEMVILSMNSRKGIWEIDGAAQVDPSGQSVITKPDMGITHFSTVYAAPIGPKVLQIGSKDQPGANTFDGALTTSISLPTFKSLGQDVAPSLIYRSSWAKPTALITNLFDIPKSRVTVFPAANLKRPMTVERCRLFFCSSIDFEVYSQVETQVEAAYTPEFITAQFFGPGLASELMKFSGPPNRAAISYAMDLKDSTSGSYLVSGAYPYQSHYEVHLKEMIVTTRSIKAWTSVNPPEVAQDSFTETQELEEAFPADLGGSIYLQNETQSVAGRGWKIAAGQRISNPNENRVMLEEEDGTVSSYTLSNSISTLARASDQGLDFSRAVDVSRWPDAYVMNTGKNIYRLDLTSAGASAQFLGSVFNLQGGVLNATTDYNYLRSSGAPPNDFTPSTAIECVQPGQLLSRLASHCDVQHSFYTYNDTPRPQQFASLGNGTILATDQSRSIIFQAVGGQTSRLAGTFGTPPITDVFENRYHAATSDPNGIVNFCHLVGLETYQNNPGVTANSAESNNRINSLCATPGMSCSFWFGLGGVSTATSLDSRAACASQPANGIHDFAGPGEWPTAGFNGDGVLGSTQLNQPMGIAVGPSPNVVAVADTGNNRVRLLNLSTGTVSTIAGNGQTFDSGDGGPATSASIFHPRGVAYDILGNLYISSENGLIRQVDPSGRISTFAGNINGATNVGDNIPASQLKLTRPYGMVADNNKGYLYVADTGANVVRRIDFQTKTAVTVAGTGFGGFNGEDAPSALQLHLSQPQFVGLDNAGNLIIVDSGNQRIRRVVFQNVSNGILAYSPVTPDNTQLKRNGDGTWIRSFRNGSVVSFNEQGQQLSTVDRSGRATSYQYDGSGRLQSMRLPTGQQVTYQYSGAHLSSIVDPAGRSTNFSYDGNGNLMATIFPDGSSRNFEYDSYGLLTRETNQRGLSTHYFYNEWNRLSKVVRADSTEVAVNDSGSATAANNYIGGNVGQLRGLGVGDAQAAEVVKDAKQIETKFTKDYRGYISTIVDAEGKTTQLTRDFKGNVTEISRPDGTKVSLVYDQTTGDLLSQSDTATGATTSQTFGADGNLLTQTNGRGFTIVATYDQNTGLLLSKTDPLMHSVSYTYNALALVATVRNPLGKFATLGYDSAGNLLSTTDPLGHSTILTRDDAGNVKSARDPAGNVTRYEFDPMNRISAVLTPKNERIEYSYLATGALALIKDPIGNLTSFEYDLVGRLAKKTDSQGHVTRRSYDENGNLVQEIDPNGNVKQYSYDNSNRLTKKALPDNILSLSYDSQGNTTSASDLQSELLFTYDLAGRLRTATTRGLGAGAGVPQVSLSFSYDMNGNRIALIDPVGSSTFSYDAADRLSSLTNPKNETFNFDIDAAGRLSQISSAAVRSSFTFDDSNQLLSIVHRDPASAAISSFTYTRDLVGHITNATTARGTRTLSYNENSQIVAASNTEAPPAIQSEAFAYDSLFNRAQDQGGSYQYDQQSQRLVEDYRNFYFYDANGNLTSKQAKGLTGELISYSYSSENQLLGFKAYLPGSNVPVREVSYLYDALGRRIEKRVTDHQFPSDPRKTFVRRYVYDGREALLEFDDSNRLLARYTHSGLRTDDVLSIDVSSDGVNQRVASAQGSYFYVKDSLGSITDIASSSGAIVQHYVYSAFGQLVGIQDAQASDIASNPALAPTYSFTGREFDSESGFYYYRARYYDASLGRFIQKDPHPGNPVQAASVINSYGYCGNNPGNFTDPTGAIFGIDDLLFVGLFALASGIGNELWGDGFLKGFVKGLGLASAVVGVSFIAAGFSAPGAASEFLAGGLGVLAGPGVFNPNAPAFFKTFATAFLIAGAVGNFSRALGELFSPSKEVGRFTDYPLADEVTGADKFVAELYRSKKAYALWRLESGLAAHVPLGIHATALVWDAKTIVYSGLLGAGSLAPGQER